MAISNYSSNCLDSGVFLYLEGGRLDWKGKIKKYCKYNLIKNDNFTHFLKIHEVRSGNFFFLGFLLIIESLSHLN